jgi:hypothetical protein
MRAVSTSKNHVQPRAPLAFFQSIPNPHYSINATPTPSTASSPNLFTSVSAREPTSSLHYLFCAAVSGGVQRRI